MTDLVPTQADREAAAKYLSMAGKITARSGNEMLAGKWDDTEYVIAFARHAATARLKAMEEAAIAARDSMVAHEWPPQDGDVQIDEVMAAIRALAGENKL